MAKKKKKTIAKKKRIKTRKKQSPKKRTVQKNKKEPKDPGRNKIIDAAWKKRELKLLQKLKDGTLTSAEIKELELLGKNNKPESPGPLSIGVVGSQKEVAEAFNVSVRTVEYWARDGMPSHPEGYHLVKICEWRAARIAAAKTEKEKSHLSKRRRNRCHRIVFTCSLGVHKEISGSLSLRNSSNAAIQSLSAPCPQKRHLNVSPLRLP